MKKIILISILLLSLLSCRKTEEDSQTILLLHYFTGNLSAGIDNLTTSVNSNQKNFNLITTPMDHEEFKVSIRIQLESQNPPDLFTYWAGSRTKYLVKNDKISPITDIFKTTIDPSVFDKSVLNACSYNGEIYMLPITRHYVGFFYNKKIFNDYSIHIPKNWDDLIKAAEVIKANGVTPFALGAKNRWPAQFWFDYILLRTAGYSYREKLMNNEASYNDQEVINTMELWKGFIDRGFFGQNILVDDWDKAVLDLATGDSAMTLMGTWTIPTLEAEGLEADVDYGFFSFPIIDPEQGIVSLGPIDGVLLSKGSRNKEISKDVLYQLTGSETQEAFNSNSGAIAPQIHVKDDIYNPIQLQIKDLIKQSKNWAFNYDLATTPIVSEAGLNFFVDFLDQPDDYVELLDRLEKYKMENKE